MKIFPNYLNKSNSKYLIHFNELLQTLIISEFKNNFLFLQILQTHGLIWKKIFMKRKYHFKKTNYFNFLKSTKVKTLLFSEKKIWNKHYFFYSNLNFTRTTALTKIPFISVFFFLKKTLNFIYFLNKIQFYRILFLTINFKNFNFFKNTSVCQNLISFNSKFI